MYEQESKFLKKYEPIEGCTNQRRLVGDKEIQNIIVQFPLIPKDYLAYLKEIGEGAVFECQFFIYSPPALCHKDNRFSWFNNNGRNFLVFGDNWGGDLFAFDVDNDFKIMELCHCPMKAYEEGHRSFRSLVREMMGIGPDGEFVETYRDRTPHR